MPREQITHNRIIESRTPAAVDGIPSATFNAEQERRNVHIAWDRSGWVQLGIDVSIADLRSMLASAEAEAHAEARKLADMGVLDIEAWPFRVMSDVLDRSEVNLAIMNLRRARDVAYGKDA